MNRPRAAMLFLIFLVAAAGRGEAQWKFAVTPFFASYFPTTRLVDSGGFTEKQANAPMFGARLTYWLGREIAIEAGSGVTRSKIIQESSGTILSGSITNKQNGYLVFNSLRLMYKPARSNFFGSLGGSLINRRGEAWPASIYPGRDTFGGIIGIGARSEVTSGLSLWVSAELHAYLANFDGSGPMGQYYHRTLQRDLVVTIGAPIAILNR